MARHTQPTSIAPTAFSYQRFSSAEQGKGDSVRRQSELRDAWLAKSGAVLDTSLVMTDRGVSAFTGSHRDNPDRHALAAFLELVNAGRVPRGSYLVLESLDRLTREHIRPALTLLLNLIEAGVKVVQLLPAEAVYDENADAMNLMLAIMELSRGHSESRMKSERLGRAWREKKRQAAAEGKPLTKALPAWVQLDDGGKLVLVEERAETVRRIFTLATNGYGINSLTKKLNTEGVKPIGRAEHWARSYVAKIIGNRAAFGEYQPHAGHIGPNRKPDGAPIPHYFPAVITEDQWHAAQAALKSRLSSGGRVGKSVNIFSGLLYDARDGGSIHTVNKGGKSGGPAYVSYNATQGVQGSVYVSFPRQAFEDAILSRIREINPADVLPNGSAAADRVSALRGREIELEERIEKLKAELMTGDEIAPLVAVLRTVEAERLKVVEELAVARREAASPIASALGECKTLADALKGAENPTEMRMRLRGALRRAVERIECLFVARDPYRLAAVQIAFAGMSETRVSLIWHRSGHGNAANRRKAESDTISGAAVDAMRPFDLREKKGVAVWERFLSKLDTSAIG